MTTRMLINANVTNELRIAIVVDGDLVELDIEASDKGSIKGHIYKGVVHNVEGSLAAAFVDFGAHKQGFLPFDEISPAQFGRGEDEDATRINDVMRRGDEVIVQVGKDGIGEKGASLTTYLSIAGRYTVLMPDSDAAGISRKIDDDVVRRRIRAMASKIERPENTGFIVRTAGLGQTRAAIQKDLNSVAASYAQVTKAAAIARAPSLLYSEPDLVGRTLRDFFTEDIDEVWIDNRDEYDSALEYFNEVMPELADRLHHFDNPIPIFAYHHVEEQIECTYERNVSLPSGGSIVVDETEALVAIDVNSGKMTSEKGHEETVFKTNCEAAEELAKQLKLRDLGGIVVVDFIDMELTKHKREVEKVLLETSKEDKARYKISRINSKGLCVLTRQRIRQGLRRAFQRRCEVCEGTGWLRSAESHSLSLLRRIETRLAQGGVGEARVLTHRETAEHISNRKRVELLDLERRFQCRILITARVDMDRGKDEVAFLSKGEVLAEITEKLPPREERRRERESRGRRQKKKKTARTRGSDGDSELEDDEPPKKRKTRSRRRPERRPKGAEGETAAAAADALPETVGGATFTGRPPPELLEKLRVQRKSRQSRRSSTAGDSEAPESKKKSPAAKQDNGSGEPKPESGQRPARTRSKKRASPPSDAPAGEEDRSLLDRIFGSR